MAAIETVNLVKTYQPAKAEPVTALAGASLEVGVGEIYALLGPNGAGKTTLLSILTTLIAPTSGKAIVAGCNVVREAAAVRRRIGVTFQELVVDGEFTGRQVLDFHGQLYGIDGKTRRGRIDHLAQLVELSDVLGRKVETYSGGMKRRLELARGLLTQPQVLFLDEPTQGLDPQNRVNIWKYIRQLRDDLGITLLLTTHYMEEAEALADRVGIIDHGQLAVTGAPGDLVRQMGADVITVQGQGDALALQTRLNGLRCVAQTTLHAAGAGHVLQVGVDDGAVRLAEVIGVAAGAGFAVHRVAVDRPSLGDVFLAYTGEALRDG
jgi:ABC-2 type transport system ATP-binding protein